MPAPAEIYLYQNNQKKQSASTAFMIVPPAELIALVSRYWEVRPGDVIFTGAPVNVPEAQVGDRLEGGVNGVGRLRWRLLPRFDIGRRRMTESSGSKAAAWALQWDAPIKRGGMHPFRL